MTEASPYAVARAQKCWETILDDDPNCNAIQHIAEAIQCEHEQVGAVSKGVATAIRRAEVAEQRERASAAEAERWKARALHAEASLKSFIGDAA